MAWQTPIVDRVAADVTYARGSQNNAADLKGAWNVSDINRVIDNTIYLRDLLLSYGYHVYPFTDQVEVDESDYPLFTSVDSVYRTNVQHVVDAFYTLDNPTITLGSTINYVMANTLEENLRLTNLLIRRMEDGFKRSGTFKSGQEVILP